LNIVPLFLSCIITAVSYLAFKKQILAFLKQEKLTTYNYAGNEVLSAGGLMIMVPCTLAALMLFMYKSVPTYLLYALMMPILAFGGMLDDVLGDSSSKGLLSHVIALVNGKLSTGILKALIGCLIGFILARCRYSKFIIFLIDILLFPLCVNLINLLDLRPGRAIKGFGIVIIFMAAGAGFSELHFILPPAIALLLYTGGEMREVYMMGDTGANMLGGILGFYGVLVLSLPVKLLVLVCLGVLHIFAELYSLSGLIDKISFLKKLDMLGRNNEES
jgi:UDP-GlcNAc:undecaprenyl-phosphate GlcNAc-1-phosphate transferase